MKNKIKILIFLIIINYSFSFTTFITDILIRNYNNNNNNNDYDDYDNCLYYDSNSDSNSDSDSDGDTCIENEICCPINYKCIDTNYCMELIKVSYKGITEILFGYSLIVTICILISFLFIKYQKKILVKEENMD